MRNLLRGAINAILLLTGAILALLAPRSAWCSPGTRTLHAQYAPSGREVITVRLDGLVQRWNVDGDADPQEVRVAAADERVTAVAASADGVSLIVSTTALRRPVWGQPRVTHVALWDLRAGQRLHTLTEATGTLSVAIAPDGSTAATISADGTVRRWATRDGVLLESFVLGEGTGELLGFAEGARRLVMLDTEGMLNVRDDHAGGESQMFGSVRVSSGGVWVSADGVRLLASHGDGAARLWDMRTGTLIYTLRGHRTAISGLAVSPDGRMIATAGWDAFTRLWDAQSGTFIHEFTGHFQAVSSMAYSPDGKRLLIASSFNDLIKQWAVPEGILVRRVRSYDVALDQGPVTGLTYAPDGQTLLYLAHDPLQGRDIPVLRDADTLRLRRLLCPRPVSEVWGWLGVGMVMGYAALIGRRMSRRESHSAVRLSPDLRG